MLAVTGTNGKSAMTLVARPTKHGWSFDRLRSFVETDRSRAYVATMKPGRYRRDKAADGPLSAGERDAMSCPHAAALAGETGSTGIVYCAVGGKWEYVWIADWRQRRSAQKQKRTSPWDFWMGWSAAWSARRW